MSGYTTHGSGFCRHGNDIEDCATCAIRYERFVDEAIARLAEIRACARDPERAHMLESALRRDALAAITLCTSLEEARAIAAVALTSSDISFTRWFA